MQQSAISNRHITMQDMALLGICEGKMRPRRRLSQPPRKHGQNHHEGAVPLFPHHKGVFQRRQVPIAARQEHQADLERETDFIIQ